MKNGIGPSTKKGFRDLGIPTVFFYFKIESDRGGLEGNYLPVGCMATWVRGYGLETGYEVWHMFLIFKGFKWLVPKAVHHSTAEVSFGAVSPKNTMPHRTLLGFAKSHSPVV